MIIQHLNTAERTILVAEIGNNHEGDPALAAEMVAQAAAAGADVVKFQTLIPEKFVSPAQPQRLAQLRRYALTFEHFEKLSAVAQREGVVFCSTPLDLDSARFLIRLAPVIKIASGDNTFYPLIELLAASGKPLLLSTGLLDLNQTGHVRQFIESAWSREGAAGELALLHCVVSYPVSPHEANLRAIQQLATLGLTVGYSDHTTGIEAAVAAVALGARIIEKHFTLPRLRERSDFRDHQLSATPDEFSEMARRIRAIEPMLGDGIKRAMPCEKANETAVRRSIVAADDLPSGHVLTDGDLTWMRPSGNLPPGNETELFGRRLTRPIGRGLPILWSDTIQQAPPAVRGLPS